MNEEDNELMRQFVYFLEDVQPEEFADTSAVDEQPRSKTDFNGFVDEQLRASRMAWISAETYMQPIGVLANNEKQRTFTPNDEETLGDFVERLRSEAASMKAIWTFVSKRTMVASLGLATDRADLQGEDVGGAAFEEAVAAGALRLGVIWYAERVDGERFHRHGQMVDTNGRLGPLIEGMKEQRIVLFERILNH